MLDKLIKKMTEEFEEYKLLLESSPPRVIIDKSYETAMKKELFFAIGDADELEEENVKLLCDMDKPLDYLYSEWIDNDLSIIDVFKLSITNCTDKLLRMKATEKEEAEI